MNYFALDVSKEELVCFFDDTGEIFSIPNSREAMKSFLEKQTQEEQQFTPEKTIIGCESTADYHAEPCLAALEMGYQVKVINPILTKKVINTTIRRKKTDTSDAQIIAKILKEGGGEFVTPESFQQEKRTMLRTEQKLTACTSTLKRLRKSLLLKSKSMNVDDALEAIDHCIVTLEGESKQLTQKATKEQDKQEEIIDSIPGCGVKLAAIISTESGDITRFPSSRQFKAYVGIDPKVKQSGQSSYTGRITKSGNSNLRHALFMAASISRIHDPDMRDFYEKKRSEGKSYRHAVCAVSRKLCERIYAIVTKNEMYQVRVE